MKSILVDPERCVACKSCEIACAVNRSSLSRWLPEAIYETPSPLARVRVEDTGTDNGFPVQCRHCEDAPCLDACPGKALDRDGGGLVRLHDERCIGCWMCVMVCPFGAPQPFRQVRKMVKCDQCAGRDAPFCVEGCPTGALVFLDPQEIAQGRVALRKGGRLLALDFVSAHGLGKPLAGS